MSPACIFGVLDYSQKYIKYKEKVVNLIKSLGHEKFKKLISEINYEAINGVSYFKTKSQIIKRHGVVRVICENPKHKQRQG